MEDQGAVFESCEELLGGGAEEGCKALESTSKEGDYCSIERMQVNKEEGNPARLELREKTRVNERTFAAAKKMPFVLDNREFVYRMIWKSEEGKVLIIFESVGDEMDYGGKLK